MFPYAGPMGWAGRRDSVYQRILVLNAIAALGLLAAAPAARAQTAPVKNLARLEGVRANQLVGYGLVVGLEGSGDSKQTQFTIQSITNMLSRFGVEVPANQVKVKNVAAVMVTADLPAFARGGDRIDVTVSSLGDARTLQGGILLQTPMSGADGEVYSVAQGAVSIGGFSAGGGGASVTKNHPTVGRIPNGATVEKEVPMTVVEGDHLSFTLNRPDFGTAARMAAAIEKATGAKSTADDAGRVRVAIPANYKANPVQFVAMVSDVSVQSETVAKIVINERTGTIVIGGGVRLSQVAVAHGNLTVSVSTDPLISQPEPLTTGQTVAVPVKTVSVEEDRAATVMIEAGESVEDLIKALNAIKATPRDIIAILQAIKQAGGLQGDLEVL